MPSPWRCLLGLVVAASVFGCTSHQQAGEYELAPCTGTELSSVNGEWTVSFAIYRFGQKPREQTTIGELHIDAATCRYRFEPATEEDVQAERLAAAADLPFIATPRGRVEVLANPHGRVEALRLVTEPPAGEIGQTWDADLKCDYRHTVWMHPRDQPYFHGGIRGPVHLLPCERLGGSGESPL